MTDELSQFESKRVRIHKQIGNKVFFYEGILKTVNVNSILLDDRKCGLVYMSRNDIVSLELVQ